ncbi:helix-turn-helix domain-containing protein [Micrococcus sp. TA1]|uniref:helix-turn-helix domain-containing protein n=1 Tax=Micrococcus sp. TA1 TaxID=681627 RepID=UPI00161A9763|nr:helix-turn-helix transcriptional regulator [Micrococcus sp. TA1]MBB5748591.1 transcriptional regulator with XRE-family HTH domain [Micrococcus sp. TA1]
MSNYGERLQEATGRQIKAERAALGMTQAELAEKIGRDKQTVMRYEGAKRDIPLDDLALMASAFGISIIELLGRAEERLKQCNSTDS